MRATKLNVSTSHFEWAHGRKPRGRGLWMFRVRYWDGREGSYEFNGTYTEAKRALREFATYGPYPATQAMVCP